MARKKFNLDIAPDGKTATIHVRGRMKRRWHNQRPPETTKTNFRTQSRSDLPKGLNPLLRDLLNLGCATSLHYPRFRKAIVAQLNPLSSVKEFCQVWQQHTGEEPLPLDTYDSSGSYGGMVGMSWRPTR